MTVPDEAVEAAAKAVFLNSYPHGCGVSWNPESVVAQGLKRDARIAIETATPYMQQRAASGWAAMLRKGVLGEWQS